jgi:hypothetical protein
MRKLAALPWYEEAVNMSASYPNDRWQTLERALILWSRELADEMHKHPWTPHDVAQWTADGNGHFVLRMTRQVFPEETAAFSAFHLTSYEAVKAAWRDAVRNIQTAGPIWSPALLNMEDFTFRTAGAAIRQPDSQAEAVDIGIIKAHVSGLREILGDDAPFTESLVLLRAVSVRDTVTLADNVTFKRLNDDQLLELINLGIVVPRVRPVGFNVPPLIEVQLTDMDRGAFVRRVPQRNAATLKPGEASPQMDLNTIFQGDFARLTDVVALVAGHPLALVGWRLRASVPTPLSPGVSYQTYDPLPRLPYMTERAIDVNHHAADLQKRWRQIEFAESNKNGHGLRLACRRLGFAVARENDEDALLDALISLEAMLLTGKSPVRNIKSRLTQRTSWIWPKDDDGMRDAAKSVRKAYELRKSILHGEVTDAAEVRKCSLSLLGVTRRVAEAMLDRRDSHGSYEVDWEMERSDFLRRHPAATQVTQRN